MTETIELFTAGAVCPECSRIGKVISTETVHSDGLPRHDPYRRFECAGGHRWNFPVLPAEYRIVPANPRNRGND